MKNVKECRQENKDGSELERFAEAWVDLALRQLGYKEPVLQSGLVQDSADPKYERFDRK